MLESATVPRVYELLSDFLGASEPQSSKVVSISPFVEQRQGPANQQAGDGRQGDPSPREQSRVQSGS